MSQISVKFGQQDVKPGKGSGQSGKAPHGKPYHASTGEISKSIAPELSDVGYTAAGLPLAIETAVGLQ